MQPNKPAEFGGNKDESVETWLFQIEQYAALTRIEEGARAFFAASFFRGPAALWWRSFVMALQDPANPAANIACDWPRFREACLTQFRPVNAARVAREKLMNLTQTTSVAIYAHKFRTLLLDLRDLGEADRLFLFSRGLKRDVAAMVQLSNPVNWEAAAVTAENIDAVLFEGRRNIWNPRQPRAQAGPAPMDLDQIPSPSNTPTARLTEVERERLRRNGGCFRCRRTGHLARDCPQHARAPPPRISAIEHPDQSGNE
jgi:hypothetical protein